MSVEVREIQDVTIIHSNLTRVTAVAGAEEFRQTLMESIEEGRLAIAVDMHGIEYADSTMIGALVDGNKLLTRDGGTMCLFNVSHELREFFNQTVLDRFIEICATEEIAILVFDGLPKKKRRSIRKFFG